MSEPTVIDLVPVAREAAAELIAAASDDEMIDALEERILGELEPVEMPLVHRFTPGLYIREIHMKAGTLLTSKIHKTEHPFTISKGRVLVKLKGGETQELAAPYTGITKPGTRRAIIILEDTVWTTYHVLLPGEEGDIEKIEARIIEQRYRPDGSRSYDRWRKALADKQQKELAEGGAR